MRTQVAVTLSNYLHVSVLFQLFQLFANICHVFEAMDNLVRKSRVLLPEKTALRTFKEAICNIIALQDDSCCIAAGSCVPGTYNTLFFFFFHLMTNLKFKTAEEICPSFVFFPVLSCFSVNDNSVSTKHPGMSVLFVDWDQKGELGCECTFFTVQH